MPASKRATEGRLAVIAEQISDLAEAQVTALYLTPGEIGATADKHHIDAMLDIGIAGKLKVLFRTKELSSTDPKKVAELVRNQHVLPGISDGGAHTKFFTGGSFTTDMITWLVRETGELTVAMRSIISVDVAAGCMAGSQCE